MEPEPTTPTTYTMNGQCMNCGHKFKHEFERGVATHEVECPRCGVSGHGGYGRDNIIWTNPAKGWGFSE